MVSFESVSMLIFTERRIKQGWSGKRYVL
jgi:hypothetical protein